MTRPGGATCWLGILLLAACLLGTQLNLAEHGVGHAFHDHQGTDEACVECLALPGFAAVPAQPIRLPPPAAMPLETQATVPPAPTFGLHLAFHSRAPPELHR